MDSPDIMMVPSLDREFIDANDEFGEEVGLLRQDLFLGITLDPVLAKPPDVVFVGPDSDHNQTYQQQTFIHSSAASNQQQYRPAQQQFFSHSENGQQTEFSCISQSSFDRLDAQRAGVTQHTNGASSNKFYSNCGGSHYSTVEEHQRFFESNQRQEVVDSGSLVGGQEFQDTNWLTSNQDVTLLDSILSESAALGSVDEFLHLVDSIPTTENSSSFKEVSAPSEGIVGAESLLKNPKDIAKEIQREAEEFEAAAAARMSCSPSDSATTGSPEGSWVTAGAVVEDDVDIEVVSNEEQDDSSWLGSNDGDYQKVEEKTAYGPIISIPYDQLPKQYRSQLIPSEVLVQVESMPVPPSHRRSPSAGTSSSSATRSQKYCDHAFAKGATAGRKGQRSSVGVPYLAESKVVKVQKTKMSKVDRKKEQNREAATRYRLKRKGQKSVLQETFEIVLARNEELKKTVSDKEGEIAYIKGLLKEIKERQ